MAGISPTDRDTIIGANLYRLRISARLTQKDLSTVVGVSTAQYQKYERGTNRLSAVNLYLLAHRLNKPVTVFFNGLSVDNDKDTQEPDADSDHSQHAHLVGQMVRLTSELTPGSRKRLRALLEDITSLLD